MELNLTANKKASRKLMATYVDVSATGTTPEWEILGAGVEESSIEYNNETNTITDVLGITETTIDKQAPQQTFDPFTVRGGSKLHASLLDKLSKNDLAAFSLFKIMVVKGYLGASGALYAEVHNNCTIEVTSEGGSGNVDMPINVYFSNDKTIGTVTAISKAPTFKAATNPPVV